MKHKMHRLPRRRRKLSKTNYKKRLGLLKSGKPRLVIRKTNTRLIAQIANYEPNGDRVVITATSADIKGLKSFKNIPAAYLTGRLLASKAKKKGVKEAVIDIGLHTPSKGSRVFAVAMGAKEGGLNVPISEEVFPSKERVEGSHLKNKIKVQEIAAKL